MPFALPPPAPRAVTRRALLAAAVALPALASGRGPVRLRFSHVVAPDTPKGRMALHFQALVHERAGDRLRVEVHPDSQLWGDDDEIEALRLGAVEMLAPSLSKFGMAGVPEFEVFDLPYLFSEAAQVRRVTEGPVGQALLRRLERQQMLGLGFLDNGLKHMSAQRPLRRVADFAGLRVRVQASRVIEAQWRALGAQPVVLPFAETRRALASGVVNATENPLSNFLTQGLASVQPQLTLTGHGYLGYAVVTNPRFWASLPMADQRLLTDALRAALAQGNRWAAQLNRDALLALQQQTGVAVHQPSEAERDGLRRALRGVSQMVERGPQGQWLKDVRAVLLAK